MRVKGLPLYPVIKCLLKDLSFSRRTTHEILTRFSHEGMPVLTVLLPRLVKHLLWCVEVGSWQHPASIWSPGCCPSLRLRNSEYGRLPLIGFDEILSVLRADDSADFNLWRLRQVCEYFYKLSLPFSDAQLDNALTKFLDTEAQIKAFDVPDVTPLRRVLFSQFPELARMSFDDLLAVVDTPGTFSGNPFGDVPIRIAKDHFDSMVPDDRNEFSGFYRSRKTDIREPSAYERALTSIGDLGRPFSYADNQYSTKWFCGESEYGLSNAPYHFWYTLRAGSVKGCPAGALHRGAKPFPCFQASSKRVGLGASTLGLRTCTYARHSELLFVPKDSRGPRTIVREPLDSLRFQMGFHHVLRDYLESASNGHISFSDQTTFRQLASSGSSPGTRIRVGTLDLKEASDRVSHSLVRQVFRHTAVGKHIRRFRTKRVKLTNGKYHELAKLAGMGSGYTFPVMALLIYLIILSEIGEQFASKVWVYGDDVVVPQWLAQDCMNALERYGFLVNHEKSYYRGPFRESCGGDYFRGSDVTPTRLSLKFTDITVRKNVLFCAPPSSELFLLKLERHCEEMSWATKTIGFIYEFIETQLMAALPPKEHGSPVMGRVDKGPVFDDYVPWGFTPSAKSLDAGYVSHNRAFAQQSQQIEVTLLERLMGVNNTRATMAVDHRYKINLRWGPLPGVVRRTPL